MPYAYKSVCFSGETKSAPLYSVKEFGNSCKILIEIEKNPRITQPQLAAKLGLGKTIIQNNIAILKKEGYIERIGSNKTGQWNIIIDNF